MSTSSDQELAPEQLLEDFGKYLERFRSRQGPLSNLKQLLGSPLDIGAVHPITAHEEVEIRLELAGKLQLLQRIDNPSWQFTAAQFAAFLLIPTAELEPTLSEGGHKDLVRSLDTIVFAMRWCRSFCGNFFVSVVLHRLNNRRNSSEARPDTVLSAHPGR